MRAIIQSAYILRREVLRLLRLRTTGVKVMLFNDADELLLIRNAYGDSGQYLLPGGGIDPLAQRDLVGERHQTKRIVGAVHRLVRPRRSGGSAAARRVEQL